MRSWGVVRESFDAMKLVFTTGPSTAMSALHTSLLCFTQGLDAGSCVHGTRQKCFTMCAIELYWTFIKTRIAAREEGAVRGYNFGLQAWASACEDGRLLQGLTARAGRVQAAARPFAQAMLSIGRLSWRMRQGGVCSQTLPCLCRKCTRCGCAVQYRIAKAGTRRGQRSLAEEA